MDIHMSSVAGGGLVVGGSSGIFMRKTAKHPIGPQVTLDLNVYPPVLDTAGVKPSQAKSTSNFCGSTKAVGQFIRNMYNSLRTATTTTTPVTWVNPDMVQEFHPGTMSCQPSYFAEAQCPMVVDSGNQNPPLWYQATPGSHFEYQDPLHSFSSPYSGTGSPVYQQEYIPGLKNMKNLYHKTNPEFIPGQKNGYNKTSQPLNPEAKEWVPSGFKESIDSTSSIPNCSSLLQDKDVQKPLVIAHVPVDFVEITDSEIEEVRKNMEADIPKQTQDHKGIETNNTQMPKSIAINNTKFVDAATKQPEDSNRVMENYSKDNQNHTNNRIEDLDTVGQPKEGSCLDERHEDDNLALTYASIARRSPEPSPLKTKIEVGMERECYSPIESVKQPIPKIFLKDKKYPKEKAAPLMEHRTRDPLPFRTASKTQKKNSRKFLRDLRELSPAKSDCSFSGSEGSFDSNSDLISRLCIGSSPSSVISISPKEKSVSSCIIPQKSVKSQRSMSESSATNSHVRTTSESSTGSVESLDIEFDDEYEVVNNPHENLCVLADTCVSKSPASGKHPNNILAHILGLDDSDSDESDEDTDDSWDEADGCDTSVIDDTLGTLGLRLTIPVIPRSLPSKSGSGDKVDLENNVCDYEDINKRWEDNVTKDRAITTPSRVSFGDVKVHPMVAWSYAYRNSRRGPWEQYARDRARFSNRISALESVISPVLKANHRRAMYCKIYGC